MATDYDKLRADIIASYNEPSVEVDPIINNVQRKFAPAYAELMVETVRSMEEAQDHPAPLTIVLVMASVGPLVNMLANVMDPKMREDMRKLAIEQFTEAMAPNADLIGEHRNMPTKVN